MSLGIESTIGEQRTILRSVAWETYEKLAVSPDRAGRLITYDQGDLEIMSPSRAHETDKSMLGRMIERFAEFHEIDLASTASTSFKRHDLKRGFEADESYYISHEEVIRQKREIDLSIDPPPDLVIEIERSRSALDKLPLLAAIGVPEIWRYDGHMIWMGRLQGGQYQTLSTSVELPGFPVAAALEIMQATGSASETALIRRFVKLLS